LLDSFFGFIPCASQLMIVRGLRERYRVNLRYVKAVKHCLGLRSGR
jgi:hypothetical protein